METVNNVVAAAEASSVDNIQISSLYDMEVQSEINNISPVMQMPKPLEEDIITEAYSSSSPKTRLLLFDYDGTLTPIVNDPDAALLSTVALLYLTMLVDDLRNEVWIISGRNQAWLEKQVGHMGRIGLYAEHGAFVRQPGSLDWTDLASSEDMTWQVEVEKLFRALEMKVAGSHLETKKVALVWHYRRAKDAAAAEKEAVQVVQKLKETVGREWDVEISQGKCVVEVRAKSLGKGPAVGRVVTKKEYDFVACFGDDRTDEGISS